MTPHWAPCAAHSTSMVLSNKGYQGLLRDKRQKAHKGKPQDGFEFSLSFNMTSLGSDKKTAKGMLSGGAESYAKKGFRHVPMQRDEK